MYIHVERCGTSGHTDNLYYMMQLMIIEPELSKAQLVEVSASFLIIKEPIVTTFGSGTNIIIAWLHADTPT